MTYTYKEFLRKLDITENVLKKWIETDLLSIQSGTNNTIPEEVFLQGETIKKFIAMGYSLGEIKKIKVEIGLPLKNVNHKHPSFSHDLTVGEIAEASGVNTRTIKFWEEKGLVKPLKRTEGGFRLYRQKDIELIRFIKDLQTFNYTLSEIGNILKIVGPEIGMDNDLENISPEELEKIFSALEYLIEKMKETRKATSRVESIFLRRLKVISKLIKTENRNID